MVCRNISHGYMDLIRGKYAVNNKIHLRCLIDELTSEEKINVLTRPHLELWNKMWNPVSHLSKTKRASSRKFDSSSEQKIAQEKLDSLKRGIILFKDNYSLQSLIEESQTEWPTCEWSFPKGRKECDDSDYDCALREWSEETGYSTKHVSRIENIDSFKEIFMGTNYLTYKTTLFLGHWQNNTEIESNLDNNNTSLEECKLLPTKYDKLEVSARNWCSYEECLINIRPYHKELRTIITHVHSILSKYELLNLNSD
jgi:ADP-ribose pyrophosphatase YjhB (NUDIX family)